MHRDRERENDMAFGKLVLGQIYRVGASSPAGSLLPESGCALFPVLGFCGGSVITDTRPTSPSASQSGFLFFTTKVFYTFPIPSGH